MKTNSILLFAIFMAIIMIVIAPTEIFAQSKKPNVIVIVTDDMGWGDPPSYGFDRGVEMQ